MTFDTICAPATPPVVSSIAIIRISGPETVRAVAALFRFQNGPEPRHAYYGSLTDEGETIDDVITLYYQSPQSYTGEEMAEIFCHGNPLIVQKIMKALARHGVRAAEPGEFTKRAFINGKVDLTGAEAINHIITAKSGWEIETSLRQMHGSLRHVISEIKERITELKADVEAGIDFSDEEIEFVSRDKAHNDATCIMNSITDLLERCRTGERLSHGIDITITGKPNVGKSSILNLLLNQERAIVSSVPGTTRDMIREPFQIAGMHVNLVDTAGIDTPADELEKIGIDISRRKIESSPFIILVLDAATGITGADLEIIEKTVNKKRVLLLNKIDIAQPGSIERIRVTLRDEPVLFSAHTGEGLSALKEAVARRIKNEFVQVENSFIADLRIVSLLERASSVIVRTCELIAMREPGEIVAFELQALMDTLAEITGEITPDAVLDSIFSRFCIGK